VVGGLQKSEGVLQPSDTPLIQSGQDDHEAIVVVELLEMRSHLYKECHSIGPLIDREKHEHRVGDPVRQGIEAVNESPRSPAESAAQDTSSHLLVSGLREDGRGRSSRLEVHAASIDSWSQRV